MAERRKMATSGSQTCLTNDLPRTQIFNYYRSDPGETMEFRLIYQGQLRAERCDEDGRTGRAKDKHGLRKHFHPQLRELWRQHPDLREQAESYYIVKENWVLHPRKKIIQVSKEEPGAKTWLDHIADGHRRCNNNRFVPLISEAGGFTCSLDILFLRRDNPGSLITNGGDVDNRIKVLLDGLRMPVDVKELGGMRIEPEEDPFFCLLEDDSLITNVSVTTDRLITPRGADENIHDVILVIHVTVVNPSALFTAGRLV
jgi:hypothetical protein